MQQRLERRQQRHEQRHPVPLAQRLQFVSKGARHDKRLISSTKRQRGWTGSVAGQTQERWCPGELPFPVIQLLVASPALQPFTLPLSEVGILNGQLRQYGPMPWTKARYSSPSSRVITLMRPSIGDDVVQVDAKHPVFLGQTHHLKTNERAGG